MVKIVIVNEKDEAIGVKERSKIELDDIYRVTGLWITNSEGEILLAQRKFTKRNDPGKWGPAVAGTVEEGETYEENIYKEAEEELGIKGERFTLGPKTRSEGPHQHFTQWYIFKTDKKIEDFEVQENEIEQIEWFKTKKILKLLDKNPDMFLKSIPKRVKEFSNTHA